MVDYTKSNDGNIRGVGSALKNYVDDLITRTKDFTLNEICADLFTAAAGNVYYFTANYGKQIRFGVTSNGGSFMDFSFIVPWDYVAGTDILLKCYAKGVAGVVNNIDSQLYCTSTAGGAEGWDISARTTAHSPDALGNNTRLPLTFTLADADCDFNPGELCQGSISMDDAAAGVTIGTYGWTVFYNAKETG